MMWFCTCNIRDTSEENLRIKIWGIEWKTWIQILIRSGMRLVPLCQLLMKISWSRSNLVRSTCQASPLIASRGDRGEASPLPSGMRNGGMPGAITWAISNRNGTSSGTTGEPKCWAKKQQQLRDMEEILVLVKKVGVTMWVSGWISLA